MAATTTPSRKMPREYFDLIDAYPLTSIRDDEHLKESISVLNRLLAKKCDKGGQAYLDALTDLVETYENEHEQVPDVAEVDVLKFLMDQNGLTQQKLARASGISQSTISAILTGERSMNKDHMIRLARLFHVKPAVFLPRQ